MSMLDPNMEQYNAIKPPMFSTRLDGRPTKKWETGLEDPNAFENTLKNKLAKTSISEDTKKASVAATRQMAKFAKLLDFFPSAKLALMDQIRSVGNFERINAADYVDLRKSLNRAFWNNDLTMIPENMFDKKGNIINPPNMLDDLIKEVNESYGDQKNAQAVLATLKSYGNTKDQQYGKPSAQLFSGQGNTWLHNLNLYHGAKSWNPFKDPKSREYKDFESNPLFLSMGQQFMTPLQAAAKKDPTLWAKINATMTEIQNTQFYDDPKTGRKAFKNPNEVKDNHDLNWQNVPDPYSDSGTKTFDVNANYYAMTESQMWKYWDDSKVFAFMMHSWEARSRGVSAYKEVLGRTFELPNPAETNAAVYTAQVQSVVVKSEQWFNSVGAKMQNKSMMIAFGVMIKMAHSISSMFDTWGDWGGGAATASNVAVTNPVFGFRNRMMEGYINYAKQNQLKRYIPDGKVAQSDVRDAVWSALRSTGYVDENGVVDTKVFRPNAPDFTFNIGLDAATQANTMVVLRNAVLGSFSIESHDKSGRTGVQLTGPDGKSFSVTSLLSQLGSEADAGIKTNDLQQRARRQYQKARDIYNTFFDMAASMTGMSLTGGEVTGAPQLTSKGSQFEMTIYPHGKWREPDPSGKETIQKTGPVTMTVNSVADAQSFLDDVRAVLANLEPLVGSFDPVNNHPNGPGQVAQNYEGGIARYTNLRVLTDNSATVSELDVVTAEDSRYRIQVDFLPHSNNNGPTVPIDPKYDPNYVGVRGFDRYSNAAGYSGDSWGQQADTWLNRKMIQNLGSSIFEKSINNQILASKHRRATTKYEDGKKEFDDDQVEKEVQRLRSEAKTRAEEEQRLKEIEAARKAQVERDRMMGDRKQKESNDRGGANSA